MPYKDAETRRAYRRAYMRRWRNSPRGQEMLQQQRKRYQQTAAYRATVKRNNDRQQALGRGNASNDKLRALVAQIKTERGCVDCGYAEHWAALQFDHVRGVKKGIISELVRQAAPWHILKAEIDKCEVRCANCHAVRTVERALSPPPECLDAGATEVEGPMQLGFDTI